MIDFDNRSKMKLDISFLEKISSKVTDKNIELIITTNKQIKAINNEFRGKNKATDVLSFPIIDSDITFILGTIIISKNMAIKGAKKFGHSFNDEISLLFIHGLLHLIGYDHETDNGEMRKKEKKLIKKFNLPKSLIVRNK